jgi:hypothetical protein
LYLATHAGVFVWYSMHHFDRYLQMLVPLMSAALLTCLHQLWTLGTSTRLLAGGLVVLQVLWGADLPFINVGVRSR